MRISINIFGLMLPLMICAACDNQPIQNQENNRELLPDPEKYKKDTFYTNDTTP